MSTIALRHIGALDLEELIGVHAGHGDGVPYPLWRTRRDRYWGDVEERLAPLAQRFVGDLEPFQEWIRTYENADIRVDCRVNSWTAETCDIRLLAHRASGTGFFASQRPDVDVVDVHGV